MRRIVQYGPLELDPDVDRREVRPFRVARGTQVLCIQNRFGGAWVYCLADPTQDIDKDETMSVLIVGPGYRAPATGVDEGYEHVDSLQFRNGEALIHFFVKIEAASTPTSPQP